MAQNTYEIKVKSSSGRTMVYREYAPTPDAALDQWKDRVDWRSRKGVAEILSVCPVTSNEA